MFLISPHSGLLSLGAWLRNIRSPGQILLGIADNSIIPLPGSLDVFTIWLAASAPKYWPYYALMSTIGAVVGGYITYLLALEGGKEALELKLNKKKAENIYRRFEHRGMGAIAIPAMLPPPFPIVPFLLTAGALQFPRKKFLGALALGRGIRFTVIAWLGSRYGNAITAFFARYYKPTLLILIGCAILAGIFAIIEYYRHRKRRRDAQSQSHAKAA
jgi:membrane protein YqaA with SNARE-associated domain